MRDVGVIGFVLFLALASPAQAAQRAGVDMPDAVKVAEKTLVLNGIGVRQATIFNVKVYVAGLYVESKSTNPEELIRSAQVKRLDLVFVRDVDRDDITSAWLKGFKNNSTDLGKLKDRIGQLNAWMPDMKKKDTMSFLYVPDKGVLVTVNGVAKGTIPGADFASALLSIWLGRDPADDDLKSSLLGR